MFFNNLIEDGKMKISKVLLWTLMIVVMIAGCKNNNNDRIITDDTILEENENISSCTGPFLHYTDLSQIPDNADINLYIKVVNSSCDNLYIINTKDGSLEYNPITNYDRIFAVSPSRSFLLVQKMSDIDVIDRYGNVLMSFSPGFKPIDKPVFWSDYYIFIPTQYGVYELNLMNNSGKLVLEKKDVSSLAISPNGEMLIWKEVRDRKAGISDVCMTYLSNPDFSCSDNHLMTLSGDYSGSLNIQFLNNVEFVFYFLEIGYRKAPDISKISIYNIETKDTEEVLSIKDVSTVLVGMFSFQVSPNGKLIAYINQNDNNIYLVDVKNRKKKLLYEADSFVATVKWSQDSNYLLLSENRILNGSWSNKITILSPDGESWDLVDSKPDSVAYIY